MDTSQIHKLLSHNGNSTQHGFKSLASLFPDAPFVTHNVQPHNFLPTWTLNKLP